MDDSPNVATLVAGLLAESESARKYAVFKLQNLLSDPDFADAFIHNDGLLPLRQVVLDTVGNTQAYAFGSLNALLELDVGWEAVDGAVIEKAVRVTVTQPLVNIVRNALALLVLIVSRPLTKSRRASASSYGFRALKAALDLHPDFLDSLVHRLAASDHTLCANALQLVNALMRDAVVNGGEHEWPKFIKRLQDLGVIGAVGMLMRGEAATDVGSPLAAAILEFQGLTKVLLKKWKELKVNIEFAEHKRALKTIHLLSKPEPYQPPPESETPTTPTSRKHTRRHHPEKWRRLGFEGESPTQDFNETGYLGIMDLVDFVRRNEDVYQKTLMEQATVERHQRCPLARSSVSVTLILFEHFDVDQVQTAESAGYYSILLDERSDQETIDRLYKPLLLQWGRLHTAGLNAFLRLWKASGAELQDYYKIEELVRIIIDRIVGLADRRTEVAQIEEELRNVSLATARKWQMEGLEEVYEDAWGPHLVQIREQLHHESLQFMKEQRVRCLLDGSWFATSMGKEPAGWRFVRLSHNRRWLHFQDYAQRGTDAPAVDSLKEKIDLGIVTSVDSNVSPSDPSAMGSNSGAFKSTETLKDMQADSRMSSAQASSAVSAKMSGQGTTTQITIMGTPQRSKLSTIPTIADDPNEETVLLELLPADSSLASEWLDGLLMLLNQQPITKETANLIEMMEDWGVRLRMLNLRWEDVDWAALEARVKGGATHESDVLREKRAVPSREGIIDEEYWYSIPGN